ncbi:UNVERIFIED_CONTAM: Transposable element Tcb2 transposase [Trichonephila clavipes]
MQLLPWPACSPDMSPFEHVWDLVGQCLARDQRPAASKDEPLLRIQAVWNSLPQADIRNLFDSMPRHGAFSTVAFCNNCVPEIAGELCARQEVKAYRQACVSLQLEERCGDVARKAYLSIVGRIKPWLGQECFIENASILKNRFGNYLSLEEPTKNKYRYAFDTV